MVELLDVNRLAIEFYPQDPRRSFFAVKDVSFHVKQGEMVGMVGESGCGKSVTALSLLDLLPATARVSGTIRFQGTTYQGGDERLKNLRGRSVGMIFQEPMTALNPVYSVGEQLEETLLTLRDWREEERIRKESVRLLQRVHLDKPLQRMEEYPHQLSGGQRQRVMIALALAGRPDLLVADEPTTALDVTIEAGIMDLFQELVRDGLGVLMISHDLSLVGDVSDHIVVMYSGFTVERGPAETLINQPQHPYTQGLMASSQALFDRSRSNLPVIEGEVPEPENRPSGCPFHPRCPEREDRCDQEFPPYYHPINGIETACWAREP